MCKTCQKGICVECQITPTHKDHEVEIYEKYQDQLKERVKNAEKEIQDIIQHNKKLNEEILKIEQQAAQNLNAHCDELIKIIE